jgi:hypothetical protein
MNALARFQDRFASSLLHPAESHALHSMPWAAQPGFAVYRNTVLKACVDALVANFPAVTRLVGEDWMRAAAAAYAREHLPREPMLVAYGEDFAQFLAAFEPASDMPYLAEVAALDRFWSEAHVAADETPLPPSALAALAPEQLAHASLRPHAAARWHWFDERPIYAYWSRNRADGEVSFAEVIPQGEGALVTRPHHHVVWRHLSKGGAAFLDQCARRQALPVAAAAALGAEPGIDLAALMADLLDAGAFSAAHTSPSSETRA